MFNIYADSFMTATRTPQRHSRHEERLPVAFPLPEPKTPKRPRPRRWLSFGRRGG